MKLKKIIVFAFEGPKTPVEGTTSIFRIADLFGMTGIEKSEKTSISKYNLTSSQTII
jgi:hypothetical protein